MPLETVLIYVLLPIVGTLVLGIGRNVMLRIDVLEKQMPSKVSEEKLRIIVADKLDPLKEDIAEIKEIMKEILINMGKR